MAFAKKKPIDDFSVPSLADSSPEYAALLQKQAELQNKQSVLRDERRALEKQFDALPQSGPRVSARIAELLGDQPDTAPMLQKRIADIRSAESDTETAIEILRRRLVDARGAASTAVCVAVRPEYARRVKAMVAAVMALQEARAGYDDLVDGLVANDIAWTSLTPMQPTFCGDRHDGHLTRYLSAAREAGYVG